MQKLKVTTKMSYGGRVHKRGEIIVVGNNIAHGLIESGLARLFVDKDKMMSPNRGKGYKVK